MGGRGVTDAGGRFAVAFEFLRSEYGSVWRLLTTRRRAPSAEMAIAGIYVGREGFDALPADACGIPGSGTRGERENDRWIIELDPLGLRQTE